MSKGFASYSPRGAEPQKFARAFLRIGHWAPAVEPLDIRLRGEEVLSSVPFGETSSYFQTGAFNPIPISIRLSGETCSDVLFRARLDARETSTLTVLALGRLSEKSSASLRPLVLVDDATHPAVGHIRLRIIHGAPDAGPVDVYLTDPSTCIESIAPAVSGCEFGDVVGYLEVPEASYRVRVTPAGTKTVAFDSGAATPLFFPAGSIKTVITTELVDESGAVTTFGLGVLNDDEDLANR